MKILKEVVIGIMFLVMFIGGIVVISHTCGGVLWLLSRLLNP